MDRSKASICPAQATLELLGQPHMLHIIHTLSNQEWGFTELQKQTGINTRTLTKRLQELQAAEVIKVACIADARCKKYRLTNQGKTIDSVLRQLPNIRV